MSFDIDRRGFLGGLTAASASALLNSSVADCSANTNVRRRHQDDVVIGLIGCGNRGRELSTAFASLPNVRMGAICDPDSQRVEELGVRFPDAKRFGDQRELLDDSGIDGVIIATCNHWHCLAAVWAMRSGKHVYVEKPLAHNRWEGEQVVAAAKRFGKVCQFGTQHRSDPALGEARQFLHDRGALGSILSAKINCYGIRRTIRKRAQPLPWPTQVDMNLWLGPAAEFEIFRKQLHYDWHWDWNTGNGEMGNWGVHLIDDLRNVAFQDAIEFPRSISSVAGRVAWNDAGTTPNVQNVLFDTDQFPVVMGLSNLPSKPRGNEMPTIDGPARGVVIE